jgi:tetratricopeptide (TPR) repeat protein
VLLLSWLAWPAAAQQAAPPPATAPAAPSARPATAKEAPPPKTETDKKYDELIKSLREEKDANKRAAAWEQFIRENPAFPRLDTVYSRLFSALNMATNHEKALALAEEALQKFDKPDSSVRVMAVTTKYRALTQLKRDEAVKGFSRSLLESESNPSILSAAAERDAANARLLLEKAIVERGKKEDKNASPTLDTLRWNYAEAINDAGRKDEAVKLMRDILEETRKAIADLEALPKDDPARSRERRLRSVLGFRFESLSRTLEKNGDFEGAIQAIAAAEKHAANPLERKSSWELRRAGIYQKMGKPDLEFESHVRAFAARMDKPNREKLLASGEKNRVSEKEAYDRARKVRRETASAIAPFELKTLEGETRTLASFRSKVTLLNFFFPT